MLDPTATDKLHKIEKGETVHQYMQMAEASSLASLSLTEREEKKIPLLLFSTGTCRGRKATKIGCTCLGFNSRLAIRDANENSEITKKDPQWPTPKNT